MLGLSLTKTLEPHSHSISDVPYDFSSGRPHLIHLYTLCHLLFLRCLDKFRSIRSTGEFVSAMSAFPNARRQSLHLFLLTRWTRISSDFLLFDLIPRFSYRYSVARTKTARSPYLNSSFRHVSHHRSKRLRSDSGNTEIVTKI